ncbi:MAG TPA: STAS/SEC14 domain-containing protein [Chloroflexota bacterium]
MPVIQIEARVSLEQLLKAVEQLPPDELAPFVDQVLALRAQRSVQHLGTDESALLQRINRGLSPSAQQRYDELVAKRQAEILTAEEHEELIGLSDERETIAADRIAALADLARMRQISLSALIESLGLESPTDA